MASINDPVTVYMTSHSHNYDGTTRNDLFTYTTTLANYLTGVNSMATPLWNQVLAERSNGGSAGTVGQSTPLLGYAGASYACDLRMTLEVGFQALATPLRAHFVKQEVLADNKITSAGNVYDFITGAIAPLIPAYLYPGNTNLK